MSYPTSGEPQEPHQDQEPHGQGQGQPPEGSGQPGQYQQPGPYPQPGQYQQPGPYGQPGYYGHPPQGGYGQSPNTNVMAILSLVFAFVFAPAGIVLGHLARKQIGQNREQGAQLATWGLILSYIFTALYVLGCCAWIGLLVWAGSNGHRGSY